MKDSGARRRLPVWGLALVLVSTAGGLAAWLWLGPSVSGISGRVRSPGTIGGALEKLEVYGDVPDFSLVERSGRRITRADLLGRVWIANFIYTQCTETCPLQSAKLARLQAEFVGEQDLRLVSISVDPERDTPAVLSRYAERYAADPVRWLFLTGDKRAIYRLATEGFRLGVVDPDDPARAGRVSRWLAPEPALATHGSKGLVMHSPRLVLVDRQARIRAYHRPDDEQSLDRLHQHVKILLGDTPKEG